MDTVKNEIVERIMTVFRQLVPSNYVSDVRGPYYMAQYVALAEVIAEFQIDAQNLYDDWSFDLTRPEFLYQIIGSLLSAPPNSQSSDQDYREFIQKFVESLLRGATKDSIEHSLPNVIVTPLSNVPHAFDVDVEGWDHSDNIKAVIDALKPAHAIYNFRNIFRETAPPAKDSDPIWDMGINHVEDARRVCSILRTLVEGRQATLEGHVLSDNLKDFVALGVLPGSTVHFLDHPTEYQVVQVLNANQLELSGEASPLRTGVGYYINQADVRRVIGEQAV